MALTYVCSPLSAPTRAEMLANAAKASTYMMKAEQEFGNRAVAPHAYLPFLLDDTAPEERALALEFGQKLLAMCTRLVVYGDRISSGMSAEIMKRRNWVSRFCSDLVLCSRRPLNRSLLGAVSMA